MANFLITPNMNLSNPYVGVDPGPDYANNIFNNLNLLDAHNHSPGYGVQIPSSGITLNANLPFNGFSALSLNYVQFTPNVAALSSSIVGAIYEAGVDLYYNDGAGNQVRITQGGSVAGATGTITGLPSGTASASYSSPTFTFQSATSTAANIDVGSVVIREVAASANGITLKSPTSLAGNYNITLPASLPVSTSLLTISSTGALLSSLSISITAITVTTATITTLSIGGSTITDSSSPAGLVLGASNGTVFPNTTGGAAIFSGTVPGRLDILKGGGSGAIRPIVVSAATSGSNPGLMIVRGTVHWNGSSWVIDSGEGFSTSGSVSVLGISYSNVFSDIPAVTCITEAQFYASYQSLNLASGVSIQFFNGAGTARSGASSVGGVSFIAIGIRGV